MWRLFLDIIVFAGLIAIWQWAEHASLPMAILGAIAVIGVAVVPAVSWWGRRSLERIPTAEHAAAIASAVHYGFMLPLGLGVIAAIRFGVAWPGWTLPVPRGVGVALTWIFGVLMAIAVLNLALRGFGAPFAIALSRRLATDWFYARTRNPMVLTCLLFLVALALRLRSTSFLVWAVFGASPAWISILKIYEERELEIRFGESYLAYKRQTPMLLPSLRLRRRADESQDISEDGSRRD